MLRVGLTGGLGSGKSTVAAMLAQHGAYVLEADEIGRELMRPGQAVYAAILDRFGPGVLSGDGDLDRRELARLAFAEGRVEDLNAIVHPAVIARQAALTEEIATRDADAIVVVESALIFETRYGSQTHLGHDRWQHRFERLILVVAPEALKVARFVARASQGKALSEIEIAELKQEALRRLGRQINDDRKAPFCDFVLTNAGTLSDLRAQVEEMWSMLLQEARNTST